MYLLDTNIVSLLDASRHAAAPGLVDWIERNGAFLFLSAMTVAEMEAGILKLRREGKAARAAEIEALLEAILADFADRVLPMDAAAARRIAHLAEAARPQVIELADLVIAATAATHGLTVLTRNTRHFAPTGVAALDPTAALPPDP
ncbi:type II toxin-antitoxin system VapC family toxin [Ancylobacter terrae]|uniref:type II toxin-antitoxin system VapC family toxin n=1 Tax=Ancylobacter sp. sgz301288 TaxID=3342077 RepID=UPI0038594556